MTANVFFPLSDIPNCPHCGADLSAEVVHNAFGDEMVIPKIIRVECPACYGNVGFELDWSITLKGFKMLSESV